MFSNPQTLWIEILVVVSVVAFLCFVIGVYIYKKIHHIPTGDCAMCMSKKNSLLKQYHKAYPKNK